MLSPAHVIVDIDRTIARGAAKMKATASRLRKPRPVADLWIAATAQVLGATLATRNTADFEHLNLRLFNPFGAE